MNKILLLSKRVLICFTFCATIYSCNKEDIEDEQRLLGSSGSPNAETTTTSMNNDIYDAVGFKNGMVLIYTDWTNASVPYVNFYMHNYESKDSKDYPRPKKTSSHKLISSHDGGSSLDRSHLCLWGDYLFSFTPYLKQEKSGGNVKNVYYIGTSSIRVSDSGMLSSSGTGRMSASIPGLGNFKEFTSISVAQFTDRMYAVVGTPDGMALLRTKSDTPAESLSWEFVDWVTGKADYSLSIFDMEVGIREDKATGTFSETLYVGCVKGEYGIVLEQFISQGNWVHHEFSSNIRVKADSKASFAMQQGAFADLASSSEFCIQIIRSRDDIVASTAFYPSNNSFGASCNLKNHNGYLATATTVTPIYSNEISNIPSGYQQHIYVFQASHSDNMDIDRYLSNRIYAQTTISSITTKAPLGESIDDYLNDPELRQLCTLVGIIEGPPPTPIHLEDDFANLAKLGMVPTTLKFGHKEDSYTTENYTIGGGISGEAGLYYENSNAKTLKKLAVSVGGYFSADHTCSEERRTTKIIDYSIDATYESRLYARLLYVVPTYELHEYFYTDNKGKNIFTAPIMAIVNSNQMTYYYKPLLLREPPFNVYDVSVLNNWRHRMSATVTDGSRAYISTAYLYGGGATIEQTLEKGFSKKTGYVIRDQTSFNVELVAKLFRGQGSLFGGFSIDNSWSTSINDQLTVKFQQIDKGDIIDRNSVVGYTCVAYMMFENCADAPKYYKELERTNLKLPDEKPWIIGYEVTEIEVE